MSIYKYSAYIDQVHVHSFHGGKKKADKIVFFKTIPSVFLSKSILSEVRVLG